MTTIILVFSVHEDIIIPCAHMCSKG